ncbi:MAG: ATP synthase F1 subunit delta [Nitrospinota bacterium]
MPAILAKRYARALTSAVGRQNKLDKAGKDLHSINSYFIESRELADFFLNPSNHPEVKEKVLDEILNKENPSKVVREFIKLLLEKNRLKYLGQISDAYSEMIDEVQGRIRLTVTTAIELSEAEEGLIKEKFKNITGREIFLKPVVEPSLIGGIVVKMADTVLDGSIKNQLNIIKDSLDREGEA